MNRRTKTLSLLTIALVIGMLSGCVPEGNNYPASSWEDPAAYVPPPKQAPKTLPANSPEWIGPNGYVVPRAPVGE